MPVFDVICKECGHEVADLFLRPWPDELPCSKCGRLMDIKWAIRTNHRPACHSSESVVVWEDPSTGEIRYPPRNDIPVSPKLAAMGFERRELTSLHQVESFEKSHNVRHERTWFDKGSDRSSDENMRGS